MYYRFFLPLLLSGCMLGATSEDKAKFFTFRILFKDLVGFALVEKPNGEIHEVQALLLDASNPQQLDYGSKATAHKASVLLSRASIQRDGWRTDSTGGAVEYRLAGYDVEILTSKKGKLSVIADRRFPGTVKPRTEWEMTDFSWVPDLGQIVPGARFKPGLLDPTPPAGIHLAARIRLDQGELKTHSLHGVDDQTEPAVYGFGDRYRQAISKLVALEIQSEGPVSLRRRKIGEGPLSAGEDLVLFAPPGEVIEATISNSPVENPGSDAPHAEHTSESHHFQLAYNLVEFAKAPEGPLPNPSSGKAGDEACPNFRLKTGGEQ